MRVLVIDPHSRDVEERNIRPSSRDIQTIIGGSAALITLTHNGRLNFVAVNELPKSEFHFKLGTEHVFSGFGMIIGCASRFGVDFESTNLSVAEINAIATFFNAPRPPMGWLR
jgi:hypothetical protein